MIRPEGLPNFKVLDPLPMGGPEQEASVTDVEAEDPPSDERLEQDDEAVADDDADEEEFVRQDDETDRDYQDPLVGRKVKAFYDKWFTGKIVYFNKKMGEYCIEYNKKNNDYDYMGPSDLNGTDAILLPN